MNEHSSPETAGMIQARRMMAADWLQRIDSNAVSDEELKEWLEWYSQNDDNRRAFDQADLFFRTLRGAPPNRKDALRKLAAVKTNETAHRRSLDGRMPRPWAIAAVVVLGMAAILGWSKWSNTDRGSMQRYQTARGEHRQIKLSDGSSAIVGAQSVLEVAFDAGHRSLKVVSGEAWFQVKRDPIRPFVVRAGSAQVTALGTAFDVRRSEDRVTVAVTDGVVEVKQVTPGGDPAAEPQRLRVAAGERAVLSPHSQARSGLEIKVTSIDPTTAVAWQRGQLSFSGEPLTAVVESINRYAEQRVAIGDDNVAQMIFTGTVLPNRVEEWVVNLSQAFPLKAVRRDDGTFVLVPEHEKLQ